MNGSNSDSSKSNARGGNFPDRFRFRCPAQLPNAIRLAAERHAMTPTEYIRDTIVSGLKADDPHGLAATGGFANGDCA